MASDALVPSVIGFGLILVIWIVASVHVIVRMCASKTTKLMYKAVTFSYVLSFTIAHVLILIWTVLVLSYAEEFYQQDIEDGEAAGSGYYYMMGIIFIFCIIGFFSFHLVLILKLLPFSHTALTVSTKTIKLFIALALAVTVSFSLYFSAYFFFKEHVLPKYSAIVFGCAIFAFLGHCIISISIIFLVIRRYIKVATLSCDLSRGKNIGGVDVNKEQETWIHLSAKQCLLGCIAVSMVCVMIPMDLCMYVFILPHNKWTFIGTCFVGFVFHCIEMISVLLLLQVSAKYYNKYCKRCHNMCRNCYKKWTVRQIKQEHQKSVEIPSSSPSTVNAQAAYVL